MNKKYIIGNWKALPDSWAAAQDLLDAIAQFFNEGIESKNSIIICPPFIYLEEAARVLKTSSLGARLELGAQDIALGDEPAQTGEITGNQLEKLGVRYVIIGHSERRWKLGETNEIINTKLKRALSHNLIPIVCIGEKERDENFKKTIEEQLKETFKGLNGEEIEKCFLAYEPVWAISSNPGAKPDSPEESVKAVKMIKEQIKKIAGGSADIPVLYGGSVTPDNVSGFVEYKEIDGVLIGGASVRKHDFLKILNIVK